MLFTRLYALQLRRPTFGAHHGMSHSLVPESKTDVTPATLSLDVVAPKSPYEIVRQ